MSSEAVAHAHARGHEVMLATGRSWEGTRGILRVLDIAPEYVVCSNGAVIMKRVDTGPQGETHYERFHTETFDPSEVLTLLREHLPDAKLHGRARRTATGCTPSTSTTGISPNPGACRSTSSRAQPVCRVVVVSPGQTEQDFVELVAEIGLNQVSYAIGWTAWLDIAPMGVDKCTALELVRGWLGIDPAHVLVMGDGRNDVGMFRWALRERRARDRDGAGSAGSAGCRGRADHVGAGGRRRRRAPQALTAEPTRCALSRVRVRRSAPPQALLRELHDGSVG